MPFPVLAGIPWLAGIIGGLFSTIFGFVAQFITKRLAVVVAAVALIATTTAAFFLAIEGLLTSLAVVSPPGFAMAVSIFIPANFSACVASILSAHLLRWVYDWQVRIIQYKLF